MTDQKNLANLSATEAEETLAAVQNIMQKTRHSIASGSAYISLIITGIVWLIGFTATQFLTAPLIVWIWLVTSIIGSAIATFIGIRTGKRVRIASSAVTGKRILTFWVLLILFAAAIIAVAHPTEGKQITLLIILIAMIGQMGMGLLLSFSATWWTVPVAAVALIGYFLVPDWFYLWMGVLVGGTMIFLGLYIRLRWGKSWLS
jgi:hypothetical protein